MSYYTEQLIRIKPSGASTWTPIKTPHEFTIERYNLTKAGRVASGRMLMDLIAKKRRLVLKYHVINSIDMQVILNLIDGANMFFSIEYREHGMLKWATCYVGAIPTKVYRTGNGVWQYRDVTFNIIEQ